MIQTVTPDGSDQPFHVGPLPWTGWRGEDFLYAQALDSLSKVIPIYLIPVSQQVTWRLILGNRLHHLLPCPPCRRVLRHVEVNDAAAVMSQHDRYEQHPKADRRHGEEVDRDEILDMVVQETLQVWEGGFRFWGMKRETVRSEIAIPS